MGTEYNVTLAATHMSLPGKFAQIWANMLHSARNHTGAMKMCRLTSRLPSRIAAVAVHSGSEAPARMFHQALCCPNAAAAMGNGLPTVDGMPNCRHGVARTRRSIAGANCCRVLQVDEVFSELSLSPLENAQGSRGCGAATTRCYAAAVEFWRCLGRKSHAEYGCFSVMLSRSDNCFF